MKAKHVRPNKSNRSVLACALTGCLILATPYAIAQTTGATLRGQAAAGAPVTATNTATGSVRRTQASGDGRYALVGLPPGTYTVEAGPGTARTVTVSVASSATLNLPAAATTAAPTADATDLETVTVTASSLKDVRTSEVGNTISLRQIQTLPQATRNFLEFADTVPGMAFNINPQGFVTLRGGATNSASGNLYIDGIGQKGYVESGGIAGQNQTQGNPFPQLAIGEYKVITSNYKAEYGQITGAAVTAATRSGTNEFEGEVFYRFTDESLREKRPDEEAPGKEKVESQTKEYGFALGGPIIQDRMHFFFAYEGKDNIAPRSVQPDPNAANFVQYLPPDVQSQFGAAILPFSEDLFFGKISWDIGDRDRLELSAQVRDETQVDSVGGTRGPDHGRDVINKDERTTLRWQHSADAWFNELLATTEDSQNNPFPMGLGNGITYAVFDPDNDNEYSLIETGPASGFDAYRRSQKGWSIADNLTFNNFTWHGDHTIKVGVSYKSIELTAQEAGAVNPQFKFQVDQNGVATTPYRVDFLAPFTVPGQRATVETDAKQYGLYIQDDWAVNDKLMLNIGVRWDYEKNPAYTGFVTSPDFVTALYSDDPANPGQPWADRLLRSGLNAANYVSTGSNRKDFKDAWAPRFGFSYDLNADEQHVFHGGAGRSYDRNLFKQLALESSKAALSPVAIYFQDPDTGQCYRDDGRSCIVWDPRYLNGIGELLSIPITAGSAELFMLNNELKTPYSDQFSLGMTNQIGEWLTDITLQRILSYDGFVFTLINRYPDGTFWQNGSQPWGEPVPGYANTIIGNNGIESRSTQLLWSAEKPYTKASGWGVSLAYTFTKARHNRVLDEPFAFDKATIDEYPFILSNATPKHRFVAAGSLDGPWGIIFGAKIVLETPKPLNEVRSWGQTIPDGSASEPFGFVPPATGRFLVGGKIWGYRTVDLQATKEFNLGEHVKLSARLNLLNAFNFKNYTSFIYNSFGSGGVYDPDISINPYGEINYVPRTLNFELGLKF